MSDTPLHSMNRRNSGTIEWRWLDRAALSSQSASIIIISARGPNVRICSMNLSTALVQVHEGGGRSPLTRTWCAMDMPVANCVTSFSGSWPRRPPAFDLSSSFARDVRLGLGVTYYPTPLLAEQPATHCPGYGAASNPKLKTGALWVGQFKFFAETGAPDRRFQSLCRNLLLSHSGHRRLGLARGHRQRTNHLRLPSASTMDLNA